MLLKGGYVPAMQVVNFLPWCALLVLGAVELLRGNPALRPERAQPAAVLDGSDLADLPTSPWSGRFGPSHRRHRRAAVRPVPGLAPPRRAPALLGRRWSGAVLRPVAAGVGHLRSTTMTTVAQPPELAQATALGGGQRAARRGRWSSTTRSGPTWCTAYGFAKDDVIMAYKLDADPAVHARLTRLDYLVVPDWYYTAQEASTPRCSRPASTRWPKPASAPARTRSPCGGSAGGGGREPNRPEPDRAARRRCSPRSWSPALAADGPRTAPSTRPRRPSPTRRCTGRSPPPRWRSTRPRRRCAGSASSAPTGSPRSPTQPQARWLNSFQDLAEVDGLPRQRAPAGRAAGARRLLHPQPRLLRTSARARRTATYGAADSTSGQLRRVDQPPRPPARHRAQRRGP